MSEGDNISECLNVLNDFSDLKIKLLRNVIIATRHKNNIKPLFCNNNACTSEKNIPQPLAFIAFTVRNGK